MSINPQLRAVLVLPGNVLGTVPAVILFLTRGTAVSWELSSPGRLQFWLALACFALGLWLMISTMRMFGTRGEGTLAPWDPPRKLVVTGIYRRVRNPMISGVVFALWGEALLFQSLPLAAWAALFLLVNMVYIPNFEEPDLEKRFGEDYRVYKANVPRWIPRATPWRGGGEGR